MSDYKTTVGIEVHAELNTKSKMFCGCKNDPHAADPNTHICPVCMAHPGTLPVVNKEAVHKLLQVGAAINGTIADYSEFDRKNYFYPDIPKAYQISQYAFPFVSGGELAGVAITRIHLEEDTARSQHDQGEDSLVDFNRAGVPLMELVTEPVIHDSKQAGDFARELQLLLRMLGVSDANMERGEMRVEANISVSQTDTLGTKVEVKNLNSFKVMEAAIEYETKRQIKCIESGETIRQETRGWDDTKSATYSQRSKESADEYRYFPDPDITKYQLSEIPEFKMSRINEMLPKLAIELRSEYRDLGIGDDKIEVLLQDAVMRSFFESLREMDKNVDAKLAANYLTSDALGLMQEDQSLVISSENAEPFAGLLRMISDNEINSRAAKDMLKEVLFAGHDPKKLAEERGLLQKSSADDLLPVITAVLQENETVVAEYKAGKEASLKFLVGQGMKATKGAANPTVLQELIVSEIKKM